MPLNRENEINAFASQIVSQMSSEEKENFERSDWQGKVRAMPWPVQPSEQSEQQDGWQTFGAEADTLEAVLDAIDYRLPSKEE